MHIFLICPASISNLGSVSVVRQMYQYIPSWRLRIIGHSDPARNILSGYGNNLNVPLCSKNLQNMAT